MAQYRVITTVETVDGDGNPVPAGTEVNTVEWDGKAPWAPPEGTKAVLTK